MDHVPGEPPDASRARERTRRRRRRRVGTALKLLGTLVLFCLGLVLGDAFGDRPRPARDLTGVRGVRQVVVTRTIASRTITVIVSQPTP